LSSDKDKEVSALGAVRDYLWNQLRTMDKENTVLLKIKEVEAAQASEAAKQLEQKIEELEMAARNKDDVIARLRAENKVRS
jgi:S-adenosylmethionine synthetase